MYLGLRIFPPNPAPTLVCLFDVHSNFIFWRLRKRILIEITVKVGIPEFLKGVGRGLENHVEKLESEIGDLQKLLVTRTIRLKRLGIPCKDVRIIPSLYVYIIAFSTWELLGLVMLNVNFSEMRIALDLGFCVSPATNCLS